MVNLNLYLKKIKKNLYFSLYLIRLPIIQIPNFANEIFPLSLATGLRQTIFQLGSYIEIQA